MYSYKLALTPKFLGGTSRKWVQIWSSETPKFLDQFRRAAEEGRLRVQVDSVSTMEDALTVCRLANSPARYPTGSKRDWTTEAKSDIG